MKHADVAGVHGSSPQHASDSRNLAARRPQRSGSVARLALAFLLMLGALACGGSGGSGGGKSQLGARLSSGSLTFPNQVLTAPSAAQSVTVTNTGILDLSFSSVAIVGTNAGDFSKTSDTCTGAAILPNTSCSVGIAFLPTANGTRTASLQINDNAPSSPQTVSLTGTGAGPAVSFSSPSISFGRSNLRAATAAQTETITNSGIASLAIASVALSGPNVANFTETGDTCTGATLAPNATCAVSLTFTPPQGGTFTATMTVTDNAFDSPQTVGITGVGDAPAVLLSTTNLVFSDQNLGATSAPSAVTVTNTGAENLVISTATLGGTNAADFAKTADTCTGATVVPTGTCTVSATFAPSVAGLRSATLTLADNTFDSPQVVSVSGMGTVPAASFSSSTLTFSHENQGTTSAASTVIVTDSGTGKLTISAVAISGTNASAFAKTVDTCSGNTIAPASTCTIGVTFTPASTTSYTAALNFTDDASSSPQTVGLSGTGTAPVASLSSPSLAFGTQNVGTTSALQTVIVTNTGTANLAISTVDLGGTNASDFAKNDDTCSGAVVMPASQCTVSATFSPTAAGTRSASLSIIDNVPGSPQPVSLGGSGVAPAVALTPANSAVALGGTLQFAASASGVSTSAVTWSVNATPGGSSTLGTINANGLYTAPTVSSAQLVTVQATLTSNTSMIGSASVAIIPSGTVATTINPMVAMYTINVPEASSVSIQFGADTSYGFSTSAQQTPSGGGQVQILVAGMRGFSPYHMRAVVKFLDGTEFNDLDQVFTTGGLAAPQIPAITASTTAGMTPNPGIEMLDLLSATNTGAAENAVATDLGGNVIWYFDPRNGSLFPDPIKLLADGNFLMNFDTQGTDGMNSLLEEVDLAGNVKWKMTGADLNAALATAGYNLTILGTHHDVAVLPNGHLIVIASEIQNFTDLPGYPGSTAVVGDVLIDLDTTQKPVWVWSEFDHLDVNRHPMSFPDWTHTNAVLYSPSDGNLVISIRHQHWLVKIDYNNGQGAGDIVWKLGWQGDFTLQGGADPVDWFYAQHGPSFVGPNTSGVYQLTLFDNGDNRPNESNGGAPCGMAPGAPCYSRVPVFEINEQALTANIQWQDTLNLFSYFGGNAEVLGNGNSEFDECAATGGNPSGAVFEVTQDATPQIVWQLRVIGQYAYRMMRIPSLYRGVQW